MKMNKVIAQTRSGPAMRSAAENIHESDEALTDRKHTGVAVSGSSSLSLLLLLAQSVQRQITQVQVIHLTSQHSRQSLHRFLQINFDIQYFRNTIPLNYEQT